MAARFVAFNDQRIDAGPDKLFGKGQGGSKADDLRAKGFDLVN